MNEKETIQTHDTVALLADQPAVDFVTKRPILLRRGQVGTVVMDFDGSAFEIEFSDGEGRAYAMLTVSSENLIVLHESPSACAA